MTNLAITQTREWVSSVIVKYNFCPFARKEVENNCIHYYTSQSVSIDDAVMEMLEQCNQLNILAERETTLIMFEKGFSDFEDFLDLVDLANALLVAQGFEGIMCRNLSGPYLFKNRSNDLLKFKAFEDAEFTIVGAKPGVSTEKGAIVFECSVSAIGGDADSTFDVRPRGSVEKRRQMYLEKDRYIGKQLTVRYQPHTNDADRQNDTGIPRFPVGIDIRDYE